mgnify:FL=1
MRINWRVRFKNKTWLVSFLTVILAFVYQVLGMFGIVPAVTQDMAAQLAMAVINVLVAVGVVIDPTTAGAGDSDRAMTYDRPERK